MMHRLLRRVLRGAGILLVVVAAVLALGALYQWRAGHADAERYPPPGTLVDIGGRRLHLYCTGRGSPTVVLEAGLAEGLGTWRRVQPVVARTTQVCSYDRAGYGWSDPGPAPRTAGRVAADLRALLRAARVDGPLVLVGHSLGGLFVRRYAADAGNAVAGMVLVDSSHENQAPPARAVRWLAAAFQAAGLRRLIFSYDDPGMDAMYASNRTINAVNSEFDAIEITARESGGAPPRVGQAPLVILTAGRNDSGYWRELQRELLTRSSDSRQIVVENSGHIIQDDAPDAVTQAIVDVVEKVRARRLPDVR
jgi:pimeloyl-ACP methyl ester carboxylesterase